MKVIKPTWNTPKHIHAFTTTRQGGVSQAPYDSLNFAAHVGDELTAVEKNRRRLSNEFHLPSKPTWLNQIHSTDVIELDRPLDNSPSVDASFTRGQNIVCAVLTADCVPILVTNQEGTIVAAIHAGWKGLAAGVIESSIRAMNCNPTTLLVWLGPAIGPKAFEVGEDVKQAFMDWDSQTAKAFVETDKGYLGDLYHLAKQRLAALNIHQISGGNHCTYSEESLFYSYRRDDVTGRMASVIWIGEESAV